MSRIAGTKKMTGKRDFLWASYLLILAVFFGMLQQWPLVKVSFNGGLKAHLEQVRAQRRAVQFKEVKVVSLELAHEIWSRGKTLVLDARRAKDYQELHVPGALNLPPKSWKNLKDSKLLAGIDKDRDILVYCSGVGCDDALKVGKILRSLGYTQVTVFTEGFRGWDEAGYPVDTGS
jgi:rhodanese-related sulfurtransferase